MRNVKLCRGRSLPCSRAVGMIAAIFLAAATLAAQTAQPAAPPQKGPTPSKPAPAEKAPALPSARSIIDRYIELIGGRKAILAHTSSHATGTINMSGAGITGALDIYGAAPNKSMLKINLGGIGEVLEGFDGVHAWSVSPMTGPMLIRGKELEEKRFDADFYSELHDETRYASMKTVEKTMLEGRPCYKVSLVKKDGGEDFDFYDVETGLKAGAIQTRESQMGPMAVTQVQSDYKKFGGLLVPTTMKQTAMGVEQMLKITSIEFDTVPPSSFEPPAQIKALIK